MNRTCSIEGCTATHKALGYCRNHYQRARRYGDPLHTPERSPANGIVRLVEAGLVTYRKIDYWIRKDMIELRHPADGSGSRRRLDPDELRGVEAVIAAYSEIESTLDRIRSGELFRTARDTPVGRHEPEYSVLPDG